jgi:hypothetical protein
MVGRLIAKDCDRWVLDQGCRQDRAWTA